MPCSASCCDTEFTAALVVQAGGVAQGAEPSDLGLGGLKVADAVTVVAGGLESVLRCQTFNQKLTPSCPRNAVLGLSKEWLCSP